MSLCAAPFSNANLILCEYSLRKLRSLHIFGQYMHFFPYSSFLYCIKSLAVLLRRCFTSVQKCREIKRCRFMTGVQLCDSRKRRVNFAIVINSLAANHYTVFTTLFEVQTRFHVKLAFSCWKWKKISIYIECDGIRTFCVHHVHFMKTNWTHSSTEGHIDHFY